MAGKTASDWQKALKISGQNNGGREGIRTLDLLRAREALSQLSYSPTCLLLYSQRRWCVKKARCLGLVTIITR